MDGCILYAYTLAIASKDGSQRRDVVVEGEQRIKCSRVLEVADKEENSEATIEARVNRYDNTVGETLHERGTGAPSHRCAWLIRREHFCYVVGGRNEQVGGVYDRGARRILDTAVSASKSFFKIKEKHTPLVIS